MLANRLLSISVLSRNLIKTVTALYYAVNITMDKHQIVPDVIPVAPTELAKVSYVSGVSANEGNELTPTQVKDSPKVEWNAESNAFYTLCMTDPDAPSRQDPKFREVVFNLFIFLYFSIKLIVNFIVILIEFNNFSHSAMSNIILPTKFDDYSLVCGIFSGIIG